MHAEQEEGDKELNEEEKWFGGYITLRRKSEETDEEDSNLQDFDYTFSDDSNNEVEDNTKVPRVLVTMNGEPLRLGDENKVD